MFFVIDKIAQADDQAGLPLVISRTLTEEFNEEKPTEALNSRPWSRYNPQRDGVPVPAQFQLPPQLHMVCKGLRRFRADLFSDSLRQWVVSARLRDFMQRHGWLAGHYEESNLTIVSTGNKPLTDQPYYLLRLFRDDNSLVNVDQSPHILSPVKPLTKHTPPNTYYQDLVFRPEASVPPLFYLQEPAYWQVLICTEETKTLLEQEKFMGLTFYSLEEHAQRSIERERKLAR
ncbi:hypothetical protein DNI29_23465 [Hymenobacter sediminis]|uniref:Imm43 family immunity protein n=1 Tax=Hymenobacter sediminis TaxID=2218621 RepID=UPI000DA688A0|nr:hypothetical protein [Hymenobacter sediminis]RPD43603.1 hypothetical protein DNI29_23465 [Hymenobacter sediminis]